MIISGRKSQVARQLAELLAELNQRHFINYAVLSSEDGLAIEDGSPTATQLAAVAGFMLVAARQSGAILGFQNGRDVSVQLDPENLLVCRHFAANQSGLILAVIVQAGSPYKRLLGNTIRAVQSLVGDDGA